MSSSIMLPLVLAVHALAAVFWSGSAFVVARLGPETGGLTLRRAQMGSAVVVLAAGVWLWAGWHAGPPAAPEKVLAFGAVCAVAAAGVQGAVGLRNARRLAQLDGGAAPALRRRMRAADVVAALLLAVSLVSMVVARYA